MHRGLIAALLTTALLAPLAAHAERSITVETRESSTPNGKPAYSLVINGEVVARLAKPTTIGGVERTPQRGIAMAAAVLAEAYRGGRAELSVVSDGGGREYTVQINGKPLMIASDIESKAWGVTTAELATTWQQNILKALAAAKQAEASPAKPKQPAREAPPEQDEEDPLPS